MGIVARAVVARWAPLAEFRFCEGFADADGAHGDALAVHDGALRGLPFGVLTAEEQAAPP